MPPTLRPHAGSTARRQATWWALGALLLTLGACGAPTGPNGAPGDVGVTIDPPDATMAVDEQRAFTANVTGTSDTAVTWSASAGTVTGTGATVIYRAPDTPGSVTLTATSVADGERNATAAITVVADDPPQAVVVTLAPTTASLAQGQTQAFTATVTGAADTSVTWSSTCGSVEGTGSTITYTAPDTTTTCTLTATSTADPTKTASAIISVSAVGISIAPTTADLLAGQSQSFTAAVAGAADTGVTWSSSCGSVTGTGTTITYTAPDTTTTCTLTATSTADPTKTATATINVTGVSVSIDRPTSEAFVTQTRTFTATVTGSTNTNVTWAITPDCGTIDPSGSTVVYAAPAAAPTTDCTLSATSNAAPTQQASATISVYPPPDASFTIGPVDLNPPGAAALMVFGWDVVNPATSLTLTCEIYAFGLENVVTYTIQTCTTGGQTHLYLDPGSYTAVLRVLHDTTVVQTLDLSFVLP